MDMDSTEMQAILARQRAQRLDPPMVVCPSCRGTGYGPMGVYSTRPPRCEDCAGEGVRPPAFCPDCGRSAFEFDGDQWLCLVCEAEAQA
jgi:hypothetical protein